MENAIGQHAVMQSSAAAAGRGAHIFKVPFGPRLDLTTSCSPLADAMFIDSAWPRETCTDNTTGTHQHSCALVCSACGTAPALQWRRWLAAAAGRRNRTQQERH